MSSLRHSESKTFGGVSWQVGLPAALLAPERLPEIYAEWLDSYFARDVQELFRVEKRAHPRLLQLLLRQSGGLVDVSALGLACAS